MKTTLILILMASSFALAEGKPPATIKIDDPRTVTVGERSVVTIYLAQFQETMLVLPAQEKAIKIFVGDSSNWVAETGKNDELSRYISLKVKQPLVPDTTLNVVSDHDKPYTFRLVLAADHCDSKVFIDPDSQLASDIAKPPAFVAVSEVAKYKDEATQAKKDADTAKTQAAEKITESENAFRSSYPGKLHFNYAWDHKAGDRLGIQQIFNDSKFTYVRADPQEAPALYEVKDGKPSLIQFDFRDGVYTATKVIEKGYLAIGRQKVNFERVSDQD